MSNASPATSSNFVGSYTSALDVITRGIALEDDDSAATSVRFPVIRRTFTVSAAPSDSAELSEVIASFTWHECTCGFSVRPGHTEDETSLRARLLVHLDACRVGKREWWVAAHKEALAFVVRITRSPAPPHIKALWYAAAQHLTTLASKGLRLVPNPLSGDPLAEQVTVAADSLRSDLNDYHAHRSPRRHHLA